ncbi:Tetratricopeptide-like helical [Penicillium italicum]|uniref:Tetratricopeptide-like helical n=1 Tax=Penicillium italicum TaxID=40296 RepID=A0A0A2L691_PENIT|nr:Tetratricopeptide-like helical [Penicillium italicum]
MASIFRRLRKSLKSRPSAKPAKRDQELPRGINELCGFQMQLAVCSLMLAHTSSSHPTLGISTFQSETQPPSDNPRTISPTEIIPTSIDDIWLCSNSSSLLLEAEERWRHNDPELAVDVASRVISQNPFLCELDEMRCRLFIAAVQHYLCQYEESMRSLEMVVQINDCYAVLNNPESSIITGITHFIRGMNLMKLEMFPEAYLSLSRTLDIPGYSEKALEVQREALMGFTLKEAAEFDHSPAASTHALLDWEESDST